MSINKKGEQKPQFNNYLNLLKLCLTRYIFNDGYNIPFKNQFLLKIISRISYILTKKTPFIQNFRKTGKDIPTNAETMIGLLRLDNIQYCMEEVLKNNIPGDFIETGVWRGGATILMRGVLKEYSVKDRKVWVADSFQGLPKPDVHKYPKDKGDKHWILNPLNVTLEEVKKNFMRYGLLDDQVQFLVGWFKDTLPNAPIKKLSILRLDGDMYESTMEALEVLYPKLSKGGYVIVDDYGALIHCKAAVEDFRTKYKIKDKISMIDWTGAFWKKS